MLGKRDHALLLFMYNSGARASEVAALQIADLNSLMSVPYRAASIFQW
jgi:site-specific recombinase XerD